MKKDLKGKILFQRSYYLTKKDLKRGTFKEKQKDYYLMNANGTNIKKININQYPAVSLKSKKVIWIIKKDSKLYNEKEMVILITDINGKNKKILEVDLGGERVKKIQQDDKPPWLWGLRWANDGKEIIFYYRERTQQDPKYYKMAINLDSGKTVIIRELSQNDNSDWKDFEADSSYKVISPDGKKILFCDYSDIYVANIGSTDRRNLTNYKYPWYANAEISGSGGYRDPSWSPDSKYICCCYIKKTGIISGIIFGYAATSYEICIIDTESGRKIFLTKGERPVWLPEEFSIPEDNRQFSIEK